MIAIEQTLYLVYRLSPFIIVCYFILNSLLNQSLNGIVYLCGLLLASVIAVMCKNLFGAPDNKNEVCDIMTVGEGGRLTEVPLSLVVYCYTFFYLFMFILEQASEMNGQQITNKKTFSKELLNQVMSENVAVLVIFPVLIIMDCLWNFMNHCVNPVNLFAAILIGVGVGSLWGMVIIRAKNPDLRVLNVGNAQICSRPSKIRYKCKSSTTATTRPAR